MSYERFIRCDVCEFMAEYTHGITPGWIEIEFIIGERREFMHICSHECLQKWSDGLADELHPRSLQKDVIP